MDKYEYRIRAEEINALIDKKEYVEAVKIADTIDWRRVKSVMMLCKVSELYKINRRYEDSKEILLLAYDRNPGSRKIVYSLCELAIKLEETVQAVEYYKEFVQLAPRDTGKFILQYRLYEAQDVSLEERIAVLEEYKKRDYREKWAYELAYLYHRIGLATRCVEECDELILWFGEGKYVIKAMELKMLHCPLTASQQEKYDRRFEKEEPTYENNGEATNEQAEDDSALPIEIKAIEPSDGPTAKIPSKEVEEELDQEAKEAQVEEASQEEEASEETEGQEESQEEAEESEVSEEEPTENSEETAEQEEIPLTPPDDDLDIKVKTIDVDNEYSTINLQQELAKSLAKFMAEEDMVASDATLAMPFATLAEAASSDTIMGAITDDSIKNAIIAPLLQDTTELTPITEEDLLASMKENEENELQKESAQVENEAPVAETTRIPEEVQAVKEAEPNQTVEQEQEVQLDPEAIQPVKVVQEESEAKQPEAPVQEVLDVEQAEAQMQPEASIQEAPEVKQSEVQMQPAKEEAQLTEEAQEMQPGQEEEKKPEDEQITGQLSLVDIMAEWEETKKANDERRMKELRERVIQQTGPMFSNFDAVARASVSADLDLISPAEDVFKNDHLDEEPKRKNYIEDIFDLEAEQAVEDLEEAAEETEIEQVQEKPHSTTFNTEEIFGLEEKLLDALNSPEMKAEAPIEPISIDSSFFEDTAEETHKEDVEIPVIPLSQQPLVQQAMSTETPIMPQTPQAAAVETPVMPQTPQPAAVETPAVEMPAVTQIWQPVRPEEQVEAHKPQPAQTENPVIPLSQQPLVQQAMSTEAAAMSQVSKQVETEKPVIPLSQQPLVQQAMSTETPIMPQAPQPVATEAPVMPQAPQPVAVETPIMPQTPQPVATETPIMPQAPQPVVPETPIMYQPQSAAEAVAAMRARTGVIPKVSTTEPKPQQAQSAAEAVAAMKSKMPQQPSAPVASQTATEIPGMAQPVADMGVNPGQGVSIGNPVDLKNTDYLQAYMPKQEIPARPLTKEERGHFASFAPSKEEQIKVAKALDSVSLFASAGNMLITGEQGTNTLQVAQNVVIDLTEKHPEFSGRVAKITGALLAEKDIGATLQSMENSALIIEKAGNMPADAIGNLLFHLDRLKEHKVFVIMEDTKSEIERLSLLYPEIAVKFNARMDIEALDNDGLVNYAKEYAKEQEYAIDDMGVLALYTKIADLQTNEHAVTVTEVKDMVDKAIANAGKKNVAHFMDIILAKRYDGDDMIILREKDFLN